MLTRETLTGFVTWESIVSIHLTFFVLLLMPLAGCTGEGAGGPMVSSLSTPTDPSAGLDSDQASNSDVTDSDDERDPVITMTPTPTGVTAHLMWDRPSDFKVAGYSIYYGKRSSEESGSEETSSEEPSLCSYGEGQAVEAPPATITGLEPNTPYFFAIHAFNENESESLCSNEIMAVTPPAQS